MILEGRVLYILISNGVIYCGCQIHQTWVELSWLLLHISGLWTHRTVDAERGFRCRFGRPAALRVDMACQGVQRIPKQWCAKAASLGVARVLWCLCIFMLSVDRFLGVP